VLKLLVDVAAAAVDAAASILERANNNTTDTKAKLSTEKSLWTWTGVRGVATPDIAALFTELMEIMEGVSSDILLKLGELLCCRFYTVSTNPQPFNTSLTAAAEKTSSVDVSFYRIDTLELNRVMALISAFIVRPCLGNLLMNQQQKRVTRKSTSEENLEALICSSFVEYLHSSIVRSSSPASVSSDISKVTASQLRAISGSCDKR